MAFPPISKVDVVNGLIIFDVHVYRIVDGLTGAAQNSIIINGELKQGDVNNGILGAYSHAQGQGTNANGAYSHSEGESTTSGGTHSHSEGKSTSASGNHSHTEGEQTTANGVASHAEGYFTTAQGAHSHAEGHYTIAHSAYQTAVGRFNIDGNTDDYFVVGDGTLNAPPSRSNAFGVNATRTYISNSLYLPDLTEVVKSHVLTYDSASKQVYFALTSSTTPTINAAPPDKAIQFNSGSTFSGSANFLYVYVSNSLQQGDGVLTPGQYSHAEGYQTIAGGGNYSHAEGYQSTASGLASHAEGYQTYTEVQYAHAQGYQTRTGPLGIAAFAAGANSFADGVYAIAMGQNATASNAVAIAIGSGVVANDSSQTALGQFNRTGSGDNFMIGNGADNSNRHNALGINTTRTYISGSFLLPDLSNSDTGYVVSYDTATKQLYYIPNPAVTPPGNPDKAIQFNSGSKFSGSAKFTFDYNINKVSLTGSMIISGSAPTSSLILIGSGSNYATFGTYGTQGSLFTVTDISSGSLFSVNDISGLPIFDVFSDSTILLGDNNFPAYHTTDYVITTGAGPFKLGAIPTSSYDGGYFECVIKSGVNSRAEFITANWNNSTIVSSSLVTSNIGTVGVTLFAALSGSYAILSGSAPASGWTIKSIIRAI